MGKTQQLGTLVNGFAVDANGNVGIGGAANASYKLAVTGTTLITGLATFSNSIVLSATGYVGFGGGNNYMEGDNANNILRFGTNNLTRVTIASTGSVGIGTTPPSTTNFSHLFVGKNISMFSGSSTDIYIGSNFYYDGSFKVRYSEASAMINTNAGAFIFQSSTSGTAGGAFNGVERMRINASGGVQIFGNDGVLYTRATTAGKAIYWDIRNSADARRAYIGFGGDSSTLFDIANSDGGDTRFLSAGVERMRITSGGSVGIGVTPKTYASNWLGFQVGNFSFMSPAPTTDPNAILGANSYRASDNTWKRIIGGYANLIEFNQGTGDIRTYTGNNGAADAIISYVNGPYLINGGVSWTNGSSDIRKKKNFEPSYGLNELLQVEAVKYHFNWDEDNSKKRLGFKAQNLQNIIPEMVSETGEIAEDGTSYLTITPDYILPVLVKAIQELKAEIETLKNK